MKQNWTVCIFLALFIAVVLFVGSFSPMNYFEGFAGGIMPDNSVPIPANGIIPDGFYKNMSDSKRMYPVPDGYYVTDNKSSIVPIKGNNALTTEPMDIPTNGIIPYGFYKTSQTKMSQVPSGYSANADKTGIVPMTQSEMYSQQAYLSANANNGTTNDQITKTNDSASKYSTKYDNNMYDVNVQYHDNLDDINAQNESGLEFGSMTVLGPDGKLITIPTTPAQPGATYYQPGSYTFGASSYVPNYEDSVFLSRLTKMSTTSPVYNTASELGGFCSQKKSFPYELEQKCNSLDKNTCGSTSCCVLLGGSKCVSGDANGPTMKANYSDVYVKNKEQYYHQGKCYGNCQD
jgi:hypothetical protein